MQVNDSRGEVCGSGCTQSETSIAVSGTDVVIGFNDSRGLFDGTDDISGSPAVELWKRLAAAGALIRAYDPQAMAEARRAHSGIACGADAYEVAKNADAVVIATDWEEFRNLDWQRVRDMMARPLVLDCRNLLSPARMKELGFEYHSVGRPGD